MFRYYSLPSPALSFLLLLLLSFFPPSFLSPSLSQSPLRWTSPNDPCYHHDGSPRHCLSDFINAAYGVPVRIQDLQQGTERNISALTDLHNPHNLTCWTASEASADGDWTLTVPLGRRFEVTYISLQFCQKVEPATPFSISILKSMDYGRSWRPLQFYSSDCMGKFGLPAQSLALTRHQETESLCSDPRPLQKHRGGVVLAFSTLDGRPSSADFEYSPGLQDWVTATDIRIMFHQSQGKTVQPDIKTDEDGGVLTWREGSEVAVVTQGEKMRNENLLRTEWNTRTMSSEGTGHRKRGKARKSSRRNRNKSSLPDSGHNVTRKQTEAQEGGRKGGDRKKDAPHWKPCQDGLCDWTVEGRGRGSRRELRRKRNNVGIERPRSRSRSNHYVRLLSLSAPPRFPLTLSDIQVGGRCKCNGHASRCRRDSQGQAVCQCEHHTAGPDCDVCEPFYYDRPWQRATPTEPHPCVPCECNGHSKRCRFNMAVFQESGRVSGGVCLKCRHHTTGRHCQSCQSGYTRDHSKPSNHRKACQPCQCHPLGAAGPSCNQTTGQCVCREGVVGQRCSRCASGYRRGHSPLLPCIRIQEAAPPTPGYQPQYSMAQECLSYCQPSQAKVRMNLETFCLKDYVLKVQVRGKERSGPWWQFSVWVQSVFRVGASQVNKGLQALWVPDRDLSCGCPALQIGRSFLLIGAEENGRSWIPGERRLVADRSTMALQWREHWNPKLRGFRGQDSRGKCPSHTDTATQTRSHLHMREQYIPPHLDKEQSDRHPLSYGHYHQPPTAEETVSTQLHGSESHTHEDSTHTRSIGAHTRGHSTHKHGAHGLHGEDGEHSTQSVLHTDELHTVTSPPDTHNPLKGIQNSPFDAPTSPANKHESFQPTACPTWSHVPPATQKEEGSTETETET
ncbi:netrin-1 [Brachyhypopomus gauderio]|uniref:netrin-1 n=1 Tax=Brachyhypopomus gauderio TaxID=698409 RepID=UPI004042173C